MQVLELRERPFVEAAQDGRQRVRRRILIGRTSPPHLIPILIPPATIMFATTMLLEASLSMLGVGIDPNTASWGGMLASQIGWLTALASGESLSLTSRLGGRPQPGRAGARPARRPLLGEQIRRGPRPGG